MSSTETTRRAATSPAGTTRARPVPPPGFVLGTAVLAMSWAGPLVRFSDAPALVIAAWRLVFSVAFIAVVAAVRFRKRAPPLGDALALSGAVFASGYYVIGRRLRQRFDVWLYVAMVYGVAAAVLAVATAAAPGATVIAWLLPAIAETPPRATVLGGVLIVAGIALGVRRRAAPGPR